VKDAVLVAAATADAPAAALPAGASAVAPARPHRDRADRLARIAIVALFTFLSVNIGLDFARTGRPTGLLLLASEALVVVLTVVRRAPVIVDRTLRARVITALSIAGPPLVRPSTLAPLAPETVTVAISALGLALVVAGKMSLGRSFGILPANRGIVCRGLYRWVRHPIYLGYLITHLAFVAAHPSLYNVVLMLTADLALMVRALCEERTLAGDPEYSAYQQRVRWRVMPGIF
jgi:protein-S-isoprenylcysteine O-methyltransferase Ste14